MKLPGFSFASEPKVGKVGGIDYVLLRRSLDIAVHSVKEQLPLS